MITFFRSFISRLPQELQNILRILLPAFIFACGLTALLYFLLFLRDGRQTSLQANDKNVSYIISEMDRLKVSSKDLGHALKTRKSEGLTLDPITFLLGSFGFTVLICLVTGIYDWIREYTEKLFPKKS
jgi:hypothetical protein